ncbi:hypothetical protein V5O48_014876 [Marasmius crinis-equi]|uniref:Uncharacterized protein n=1 Tax=Marasmius crinis-equi TaxID=585013 RepID=A0ABR3EWE7_9AGAR
MAENHTADKLEAWKKQLSQQAAAQASKRYRERHQVECNEKARLRMARLRRRAKLSQEDIDKRNAQARARYRENRVFVLGAQIGKRWRKEKEEGRRATPRQVMPVELLDLKDRGGPEYEVERLKWKSQILGERRTRLNGILTE